MKIELAYDGGQLTLDLPSAVQVDTFRPIAVSNPTDIDAFAGGFAQAGGDTFLSPGPPLIVVNDGHRNTPTNTILQWLHRQYPDIIESATYLIATGTHDSPSEKHLRKIFGPLREQLEGHILYHDATDRSRLTTIGRDNFNCEVMVNTALTEHRRVLIIGSVEPHYFAGFTGGRKSIFPGLADFETVARNHNLANSLQATPLKLAGNPVAEHLDSLLTLLDLKRFFAIQIVTDSLGRIADLFFGPLDSAFQRATVAAGKIYSFPVEQHYDAVICEVLPPMDKNLYQAQKALENCQAAVRDGGHIIIVSACREGIGSEHFYRLADGWDRRTNQPRDGRLQFGSHKLSRVIAHGRRLGIWLYSTLPDEVVRHVFYEPLDNPEIFLYSAIKNCQPCRLAVVYDAANTVLRAGKD